MRHNLTFDGKPFSDFGAFISGVGIYNAPERDVERIEIPGRTGDLFKDNGRFRNIEISYPCYIVSDFGNQFNGLKEYLCSKLGYAKLEDSYAPDHYRLARPVTPIEAVPQILHRTGSFILTFDCDARRFLKNGDNVITLTANGSIFNPTYFDAKPLIRAYGTGSFTINDITVTITSANVYTDIDCEIMDAYKGTTNCNGNISTTNNEFPALRPGANNITLSGITKLEITPRWWTI